MRWKNELKITVMRAGSLRRRQTLQGMKKITFGGE
jgi:hypothetical protein